MMNLMMLFAMTLLPATTDAAKVNPIEAYIAWSRGELKAAGLVRKTTEQGAVYWIGGAEKGKTVVLLHGVNDQAGTWAQVVRPLMREYRLIVPDLAGHGESEPASGAITFEAILKQLEQILDREAPKEKLTLAGNSMGGWVSMLYALEHPERIDHLFLEDSSGIAWDMTGVPLRATNREEAAAMMRAVHGPEAKFSDELLDAFVNRKTPQMARFGVPDIAAHLVDSRLKDLKVKVAIVWGRHDGILSLDFAKSLHQRIAGSTFTIIEGAAHIPHRQTPERFVECLKASF